MVHVFINANRSRVSTPAAQTLIWTRVTRAIIAIVEEKRAEVMAEDQAGYFIHDWQELSDQVRQMILRDVRYQAIKAKKAELDANLSYFEPGIPKGELP